MEKAVSQAESQLGSTQGFTTVIKPLFFVSKEYLLLLQYQFVKGNKYN